MIKMLLITAIMNKFNMIYGWWLVLLIIGWVVESANILLTIIKAAINKE